MEFTAQYFTIMPGGKRELKRVEVEIRRPHMVVLTFDNRIEFRTLSPTFTLHTKVYMINGTDPSSVPVSGHCPMLPGHMLLEGLFPLQVLITEEDGDRLYEFFLPPQPPDMDLLGSMKGEDDRVSVNEL